MKVPFRPSSIPMFLVALAVLATAAPVTAQAAAEPLEVQLDDTGVATKFVNPLDPVELKTDKGGRDEPLRFFNTTGDRTFIVTIPFLYSAQELASVYAVADEERGGKGVSEIVCAALKRNDGVPCSGEEIRAIDTLERLRVLAEAVSIAKDTTLARQCGSQLKGSDCIVETLFWRAACVLDNRPELRRFARQNEEPADLLLAVKTEAGELVRELLGERSAAAACTFESIKDLQERVDEDLVIGSDPRSFIDPIAAEAKSEGLKARFAAERVRLAKKVLQEAINERIEKEEDKAKVMAVLDHLEEQRKKLQKGEKCGSPSGTLQCQLRELEAAAKLLTSYGLSFKVPYSGVPATLVAGAECKTYEPKEAQSIKVERAAENGFEITDCTVAADSTTCVATATIPPYGQATFPPSILAHHPKQRIAFTVAFFGETEVPANATGYVIRPGASPKDKMPEKVFTLSLGGDTSSSLDPNKGVEGQLRHAGSNGTLSFLYTGAVEASATLKYKQGDFGGPADSNKIEASQYQGKVFGHKPFKNEFLSDQAISFQYGRLQFAKPSSGIAVNVFGEGLQLALGSASLAYVVLRESDNLKDIADTQNDDSSLWILQVRNVPLPPSVFRTFDFVALRGEDRKDQEKTPVENPATTPLPIPFRYTSIGGEVRWGAKSLPALGGSLAAYYSERNVDTPPPNRDTERPLSLDGQGWTVLARATWTPLVFPKLNELEKGKPRQAYGVSLLLGYGTGDNKKSDDKDEGYLGENTGFSNDVLFLTQVSKAFPKEIGSGLANKWYGGLQLTDAQAEWLAAIPKVLGVGSQEIASTSVVLSLHTYHFVREVHGLHWGGAEVDGELNVEAPKSIRWSLVGAYYRRSSALEAIGRAHDPIVLDHDLWSVTAKLSIGLSYP